ncbi:peptidoglycan-binding protein [Priestia aryabhattai]|uniref:peptidoglycan-binding protein n=1 Tax=Priestia aryabhattai TaxID=412384 RepID=UPI002E20E0DC|nr:peptidoglycan-binding protein [Priestia aryabhattai]MED4261305.1 peptidoglycan-binding protein [Priestia aryabhattai]
MSDLSLDKLLKKAENKLQNVHEIVQEKAYELIRQAYKESIFIVITEGFRSIEQQHKLYSQGRTTQGSIVTNAKGGYSYHNYGLAIDIALLDNNGEVDWTIDRRWNKAGEVGKRIGLEWGGDWKSLKDYPHFQYTFGLSLSELRSGKKPETQTEKVSRVLIEYGDRGNQVQLIQRMLIHLGYSLFGGADGIFGSSTLKAVKAFQQALYLQVDGIVGPKTLEKLYENFNKTMF